MFRAFNWPYSVCGEEVMALKQHTKKINSLDNLIN